MTSSPRMPCWGSPACRRSSVTPRPSVPRWTSWLPSTPIAKRPRSPSNVWRRS